MIFANKWLISRPNFNNQFFQNGSLPPRKALIMLKLGSEILTLLKGLITTQISIGINGRKALVGAINLLSKPFFKCNTTNHSIFRNRGAKDAAQDETHGILEGISSLHSWIKTQTMIRYSKLYILHHVTVLDFHPFTHGSRPRP
jgi:hypothetical protein